MNGSGKPELPPQEGDETCLSYFCGYAEQGNACAQYMYGKCFHYGLASAPKKVTQAAYWYAKAAEQGYAPAQLELGALFESGRGVAQDNVQASNWYCLAAKQGEAEAQYRLGSQFYKGLGVPEDIRQAEYWFSLASIKGFKNASVMLEICKAGVSHAVMERMSKENAGNHG
jgi:TPR repeat protein